MKYTHIVWDFNGTVLDDVDVGIECVNRMLCERGLPIVESRERYRDLFGFPIRDYYKRLGFDMEHGETYDDLAVIWVDDYMRNIHSSPINQGVNELIRHFGENGVSQVLISATELNMLKGQLMDLGLENSFDGVYGLDNIKAAGKLAIAENWRKENKDAAVLVIGDTDHDAEMAKLIGADCILYSGGHGKREVLESYGVPVVDDLCDIISLTCMG